MKAQCASLTLYHFTPGHHREVCVWHDQDHKPEVVGTIPGIFISQRWVAPPDLMAARPSSSLAHAGGEYVNLYWTTTTPEQLGTDFQVLGRRLEMLGRMEPMRYIDRTWGGRLRPVSAHTQRGLDLSAEAVTCAPHNTGLMLIIEELREAPQRDAYARWHETEHIPRVLETGLFTGAVKLMVDTPELANVFVVLYYTSHADPCTAYTELQALSAEWQRTGQGFPDADSLRAQIHDGMYRPSIGQYEFYA